MTEEKHILSILTRNSPGVLSRISGLLRRKLFNIDSLTVGRTHNPKESLFTITIIGSKQKAIKAAGVIERLIEIRSVKVFEPTEIYKREIVLTKLRFLEPKDKELLTSLKSEEMFIQEIDTQASISIFELVDKSAHLESFLEQLNQSDIQVLEWVRSGVIALEK